ncbi:hypothetical protein ALP22_03883 [Pseudomonas coronafaciens pv. porri]|nr:Uncharacterized protein ALO89_01463 [Pseudomonas coronafaciens pv. porri]RMU90824.1 hypothetical protein ALP22_03883 [Pseudomonas coronafaciens pv. porri]RMW03281.1 hypothetical protein ALP00_01736 [Pseudomonas coronafaciens pv. porri]RMW10454.1 hypothetical protein ALO99_01911 [Pseudomonas coronafaciens pv. porri]
MNINGVPNQASTLQLMTQPYGASKAEPTEEVGTKDIIASEAKLTKEKKFYEQQKEPWLLEPVSEHIKNRLDYVAEKKLIEILDLALMEITYSSFQE